MNNYSQRTPLDHQDCSVRQESLPKFHQIASSRFLLSATSESTSRLCRPVTSLLPENRVVILIG